jgi:thiol-disulfide isomerase/thioredoxin
VWRKNWESKLLSNYLTALSKFTNRHDFLTATGVDMTKRLLLVFILIVACLLRAESPLDRAYRLYDEKKYEEGLVIVDSLISTNGGDRNTLQAKYYLLDGLKRYPEALEAALAAEKVHERKSPWDCILITEACIKLNRMEDALDWLEKAVARGFISLKTLSDSIYIPLQTDRRFQSLAETIKKNIGIGRPAKEISLNLPDGSVWSLSKQKGKVVLIDFFATWCPPCREEMPNLKSIRSTYPEDSFELISISLDSDREKLDAFIREQELNWHFAFSGEGWNDPDVKLYHVNSIPSIWLVDKKGNLRYFDVRGEELAKTVKNLVEE